MAPTGMVQGLKGTGYKAVQSQNFTPEQMQLFQRTFGQIAPDTQLSRMAAGDQSSFDQLEAPALKQFNALQGNLASRFSGMGTGARNSSGFYNAANTAAQDFAQQLQSQRLGLQRQAQQDLWGMSQDLLNQRAFDNYFVPKQQKQPGFLQQLLGSLAGGAGQVGGRAFMSLF